MKKYLLIAIISIIFVNIALADSYKCVDCDKSQQTDMKSFVAFSNLISGITSESSKSKYVKCTRNNWNYYIKKTKEMYKRINRLRTALSYTRDYEYNSYMKDYGGNNSTKRRIELLGMLQDKYLKIEDKMGTLEYDAGKIVSAWYSLYKSCSGENEDKAYDKYFEMHETFVSAEEYGSNGQITLLHLYLVSEGQRDLLEDEIDELK